MSDLSLKETKKEWHGSLRSYVIGFTSSFLLTITSFLLVATRALSGNTLIHTIIVLALVQAVFQMRFFLHLGEEPKPRWETLVFGFMLTLLLIIVIGTLWIMNDLNERVMSEMVNP
jgi:cytochrome o ubiquinol oxidase subunit IV